MAVSKSKLKVLFSCVECGATYPKWTGKCDSCGEWNTIVEEPSGASVGVGAAAPSSPAIRLSEVPLTGAEPWPTGIDEVDLVLGGGLTPGSVTLLGGEPGVGKSTLLLQVLKAAGGPSSKALYISAEEAADQVRRRAERVGVQRPSLYIAAETDLRLVLGHLDQVRPAVMVVDSIQSIFDPEMSSAPGSVAQVRQCAHRLVEEARRTSTAVILVGHVTKEGSLAGPRVLEHVVDTVLSFEGDRNDTLRFLRAVKHRFGSTSELGIMSMETAGLSTVANPSALFLSDRQHGAAGSVVIATLNGRRPLLVEVQSLLAQSGMAQPRRSVSGVDSARIAMLLAVLGSQFKLKPNDFEAYVSTVGGGKVTERGADIGMAMSMLSSVVGRGIDSRVVLFGEVGLGGEVRAVSGAETRLVEAANLGFKEAIVPLSTPDTEADIRLSRCETIGDVAIYLGLVGYGS